MKIYYTLGFLFDNVFSRVALIRKLRPDWQAGLLNGIGGHVEENETPDVCMAREFKEEAEFDGEVKWHGYATMKGKDFEVFCFAAQADELEVKSKTDELIEIQRVDCVAWDDDCVENLPWLIQLAIDSLRDGRPVYSYIEYP